MPVKIKVKKEDVSSRTDEGVREDATIESLTKLKARFQGGRDGDRG